MHLIFGEEMIQLICVYALQGGKPDIQKDKFYNELVHKLDMKGTKELTLGIGNFNGQKRWMDLWMYMEEMKLGSEIWNVECCWNSAIRTIYVW